MRDRIRRTKCAAAVRFEFLEDDELRASAPRFEAATAARRGPSDRFLIQNCEPSGRKAEPGIAPESPSHSGQFARPGMICSLKQSAALATAASPRLLRRPPSRPRSIPGRMSLPRQTVRICLSSSRAGRVDCAGTNAGGDWMST